MRQSSGFLDGCDFQMEDFFLYANGRNTLGSYNYVCSDVEYAIESLTEASASLRLTN